MAQLTWRNIDAPDFGSAIRALSDSNNQLQRAFSGVGQAFTDYGVRRQNENTGNIELALSKYGTNADLQAAIQQGLLDPNALREQYGNFNAADIAKYQNALANDLQTREVNQQGIDQTNNLNKYGGQITDALVRARQNDRSGIDALSANPDVLGSVLAKYSQDIASNLGAAGQDAETVRSHRASEANAAANTAIARMNADLRKQEFDAGAKGRLLQNMQYDQAISNKEAGEAGTKALSNLSPDVPLAQFKQNEVLRLQKEGKSNEYITSYMGGLDKAYGIATTGSPDAPVAAATLASVDPTVKGNVSASNESINTNYESKDQDYRTWRDSRTQEFTDINKATDAILAAAPDADRAKVRAYLNEGLSQQRPLGLLVAAAKNNTQSTFWGAVGKGATLGIADNNSATFDYDGALRQAARIQDTNATNRLTALDTERNADVQRVNAANDAVTAAQNLYTEMVVRSRGSNTPQAQAAYANVQKAIDVQSKLREELSQRAQATLKNGGKDPTTEDLQRAARYQELLKRTGNNALGQFAR